MASAINREFFFSKCRQDLFGGKLNPSQVEGMTAILDEWEAHHASEDDRHLAYMFATAHHETDRKMQPIDEYGGNAYFTRKYGIEGDNPARARRNGNTEPGDGPKYHGRGFVQLTWKNNYEKMTSVAGVNLVKNPERAKDLRIAIKIMFFGMIEGSFTGHKLAKFFSKTTEDWVNARRVINGVDKANLVGTYGRSYYGAISYTL